MEVQSGEKKAGEIGSVNTVTVITISFFKKIMISIKTCWKVFGYGGVIDQSLWMKLEPKRKGFKSARLAFNPVIKFRHKMVIMKDDMIVNNFNVVMIRSLHVHYLQIERVGGHLCLSFCNLGLCDLGDSQVSSSSSSSSSSSPRSFSRIIVMITMTIDKA